jgi:hypothetical protein
LGRLPLTGIVDMLFLEAWHRLEAPETLARPLGYSNDGGFRLTDNYQLIWRTVRLSGVPRNHPRPAWLRLMNNLVTQFDAAEMTIWEYALVRGSRLANIGQVVKEALLTCHGMVMFTDTCVLVERPRVMQFDDTLQLSSTTAPAVEWRDRKSRLYAVNGVPLSPDSVQMLEVFKSGRSLGSEHFWYRLANMRNAAERVAVIELMGWTKFLDLARHAMRHVGPGAVTSRVSQDDYGELWQVVCGNQTLMLLQVVDKSPSEHGKYETYVIPVDPRLRPLPNPRDPNATMGQPQPLSALNAVASTFGLTGKQYAAMLGDES